MGFRIFTVNIVFIKLLKYPSFCCYQIVFITIENKKEKVKK